VDMERWLEFKAGQPEQFAQFMTLGREKLRLFERPFVSWRNDVALFMGPRQSGFSALDVDDQTEVEIRSHRLMAEHLDFYRANAPGFEAAFLMLSAPQLGVRHSRRLAGVGRVTREQWPTAKVFEDEIGVPVALDGLLACGRHVACDPNSHGFLREIPQCWITGQAAGAGAALAANCGIAPRAVDIAELQSALVKQGVYLRPAKERIEAASVEVQR
jgi:hypothetical protein